MAVNVTLPSNFVNGQTADASQVMGNFNAIVTALANSAAASGVNNDITALSALSTPITPAQGGTNVFVGGGSGGSANAQTINVTPAAGFSLTPGYIVTFVPGFTNTVANLTLNVNSTGAVTVRKASLVGVSACTGGEFTAGVQVACVYDGTQWMVLNPATPYSFGPLTSVLISAGNIDLKDNVPSHFANVVNTGTVGSFTTLLDAAFPVWLLYNGAGNITFTNSSSLVCPLSQNYLSSAGDLLLVFYNGSNQWLLLPIMQVAVKGVSVLSQANVTVGYQTASPTAGGNISNALFFGQVGNLFGIFYGSGAPTIVAGQGSLYLRTDGSSTSTRAYISTGAAWTAITTAT